MPDAITDADKQLKRVQRYARLLRDQGSRAMPKLDEALRELMWQLDKIHDETMSLRTEPGAISPYGKERIASADRALDALHRFVRDPAEYSRRANVRYGFDPGSSHDVATRAADVATNAFQSVRAARTIVAGARRDPERGRFSKKALWKDIDRTERERRRARLLALKGESTQARATRRQAREAARRKCLRERRRARFAADRIRARAEARAKAKLDAARQSCALGRAFAQETLTHVHRTREAFHSERGHQRELRAIERSAKSRTVSRGLAKTSGRARARERRSESDDDVRANIDPSLHALFNRVKRGIHATPRMSRTEAFMQYVEEHPREADAAIEDATDALIAQLERRQRTGSDVSHAAVARDGGRRYLVYVAEIDGPRKNGRPDLYVGSTARGLRLRRRQHRSGGMSHRHCLGKLVPVMRVETRAEAERGEATMARALRRRGYTVYGDH